MTKFLFEQGDRRRRGAADADDLMHMTGCPQAGRSMGWVRWRQVVEALPRQSFKQLEAGAGWGLPGEFRAALFGDLLDGGEAVSTLVAGEQTFQQVGVRIGAHDRIVIRSAELHADGSASGRRDGTAMAARQRAALRRWRLDRPGCRPERRRA